MRNLSAPAILASIMFFSAVGNAFAYIDPGSGSVVTTAILGFFAAIAYTGRKYFYKAKDLLFGRAGVDDSSDEQR